MKGTKGITLIALVITIIVLLILAGVTIVTLTGDNGILTKATNSVNKNRDSKVLEDVKMAWTNAESDSFEEMNDSNFKKNAEYYDTKLKNYLSLTGHDISVRDGESPGTYIIEYTPNDQEKAYSFIVDVNGNIDKRKTLEDYGVEFGDYVDYDEGEGYTYTTNPDECASKEWPTWSSTNYNLTKNGYVFSEGTFNTEQMNWRVLGVSDSGNLELISECPTSEQLIIGCKNGYINCEKILNEFCSTLYGNGKFAVSARSLKNEDIYKLRKITEMNSTLYYGYGKKYQFKYENSDSRLKYRTATSGDDWTEWSDSNYESFYTAEDGLIVGRNKRGTSDIFLCDFVIPYFWRGNDLVDQIIYCENINNSNTWLASKGIGQERGRILFSVSCTHSNATLYSSNNDNSCMNEWVRPVVTLKSDVIIDTSSTSGENASEAYELK